jgi:hypothetical protein
MTDTTSHPPTVPAVRPPSSEQFINDLADLMAHSTPTPILRRPNEYGIDFEDVFFPAVDGVTLECSSKALSTGRGIEDGVARFNEARLAHHPWWFTGAPSRPSRRLWER